MLRHIYILATNTFILISSCLCSLGALPAPVMERFQLQRPWKSRPKWKYHSRHVPLLHHHVHCRLVTFIIIRGVLVNVFFKGGSFIRGIVSRKCPSFRFTCHSSHLSSSQLLLLKGDSLGCLLLSLVPPRARAASCRHRRTSSWKELNHQDHLPHSHRHL